MIVRQLEETMIVRQPENQGRQLRRMMIIRPQRHDRSMMWLLRDD
jgi:hypothetical protein